LFNRKDITLLLFATIVLVVGLSYSNWSISAIGLTLDTTGVLLLGRFGLPSHIKLEGKTHTVWDEEISDVEKKRFTFAKWASEGALLFIVAGFVFQFFGSIK